jgi:transcriptional regulator with XRE-family HTH domain
LTTAVGASLRTARLQAGFSLEQVARRSGGRFKPSSLGGYERGERTLSIPRFCDLAELLGVPADQMLAHALGNVDPEQHREVVIDLGRLPDSTGGREVARYAHHIRAMRSDFLAEVITLRAGDLRVIARSSGLTVRRLVSDLGRAVRREGPSDASPRSRGIAGPRSSALPA